MVNLETASLPRKLFLFYEVAFGSKSFKIFNKIFQNRDP